MKTHRTDGLSLAFGLIFLVAVGWWGFGRAINLAVPELGWLLAGALIVFGVLGLFGALRGDSRRKIDDNDSDEFDPLNVS